MHAPADPDDLKADGIEVRLEGPGALTWVRENHPPEGQTRVFGAWFLVAAKSKPGLMGRVEHRACFTPR